MPIFHYTVTKQYLTQDKLPHYTTDNVGSLLKSSNDGCVLEITQGVCRLYFDIENVEDIETINSLIDDLTTWLNIPKEEYALTRNENSGEHTGLTYHLYLPYQTSQQNVLNLLRNFKLAFPRYIDIMDEIVYRSNCRFRLPNQPRPSMYEQKCDEKDYHQIIHGSAEECVVQNVEGIPELNKEFPSIPEEVLKIVHLTGLNDPPTSGGVPGK
jgi:hypothetical protein